MNKLEKYFDAKFLIDERSFHKPTKELFLSAGLGGRVLDLGCGSGKMLQRFLNWEAPEIKNYTGVDSDPGMFGPFKKTFKSLFTQLQIKIENKKIEIIIPGDIRICFCNQKAGDFLKKEEYFEIITACSFFDLVDVYSLLSLTYKRLKKGGLAYFVCNFDGETSFEPVISPELDERIIKLYHGSMKERNLKLGISEGEYRTGRKIAPVWQRCGGKVISLGPSDWVIYPKERRYRGEERYFLKAILNFIACSLKGNPQIDPQELDYWLRERYRHLKKGELFFLAHNLDFLGTK